MQKQQRTSVALRDDQVRRLRRAAGRAEASTARPCSVSGLIRALVDAHSEQLEKLAVDCASPSRAA